MGRMAELWHEQQQFQDLQENLHQLSLERQQMAEEVAKRLATGMGGRQEIEILCREAGIDSPYK